MMANVPAVTVSEPDLFQAVEDFLQVYAVPALKDDGRHVIPGYVNDQTLPPDDGDFCVFTPISAVRRGTNIEEWRKSADGDKVDYLEYFESVWQVDCYSTSPVRAMRCATSFETVVRSPVGVEFFKPKGIDCQFADSPSNLSGLLDSGKYVSRWMLTMHLGFWKRVSVDFPYFDTLTVNVKNVDASFPP